MSTPGGGVVSSPVLAVAVAVAAPVWAVWVERASAGVLAQAGAASHAAIAPTSGSSDEARRMGRLDIGIWRSQVKHWKKVTRRRPHGLIDSFARTLYKSRRRSCSSRLSEAG